MRRVLIGLLLALLTGAAGGAAPLPSFFPHATPTVRPALDFDAHAARLRKTLPAGAGLTIVVQRPFVLVGDIPADQMDLAQRTTQWTVDHLKRDFFDRDPDRFIDIFIFKDKDSYEKNSKEILHEEPDTPFGFATSTTLAVNWSTGGGSLVQQIVHPYIEANFPKCPAWFNEGLAALYEQSEDKDGHIIGHTNWRLPLLQETINGDGPKSEGSVPSFKDLCAMDDKTFYGAARMPNYGTARYLLYYLQEKGELVHFYLNFVQNQNDDPTGYKTLQKTLAGLGETDMVVFHQAWEDWVMGLTYP